VISQLKSDSQMIFLRLMTSLFLKFLIFLLSFLFATVLTAPSFPAKFPQTFYTWMVTSVTQPGSGLFLNKGQLVAYDFVNQYACRFAQQDLINMTVLRPADYCDGKKGAHYHINDTSGNQGGPNPPCAGNEAFTLPQLSWPKTFSARITFLVSTK